jgi:hypothetical protein
MLNRKRCNATRLAIISFATLMLVAPFARAVGVGQACGGNVQNPPACDTGLECVPKPGAVGSFGDVGGVCAQICGANGQPPICAAGPCVADPFGNPWGVCATATNAPFPFAATAVTALLLGAVALRRISALRR